MPLSTAIDLTNDYFTDSSMVREESNEKFVNDSARRLDTYLNSPRCTVLSGTNIISPRTGGHPITSLKGNIDDSRMELLGVPQNRQHKTWKKFHTLQEWEGHVLEVSEDEFTARLLDITTNAEEEDEEVTFPLSELAETDHKHLCPGSIFRWVIGQEYTVKGTLRRVSEITFRELPVMSASDISEGQEWAREIAQSIKY